MAPKQSLVGLPLQVVGPVDVGRLLRELEVIDNAALQMNIRDGSDETKLPKVSQMMEKTVELNKLNLANAGNRKQLADLLTTVKEQAPVLHISFSSDPAPPFVEKLMAWLRREIHPVVLLTIGLQPSIGAGCIVRSTNHYFDFSLRQDLLKKQDMLMSSLMAEEKAS